jgi:hypothetical protein
MPQAASVSCPPMRPDRAMCQYRSRSLEGGRRSLYCSAAACRFCNILALGHSGVVGPEFVKEI